jgi:hypothetical protein
MQLSRFSCVAFVIFLTACVGVKNPDTSQLNNASKSYDALGLRDHHQNVLSALKMQIKNSALPDSTQAVCMNSLLESKQLEQELKDKTVFHSAELNHELLQKEVDNPAFQKLMAAQRTETISQFTATSLKLPKSASSSSDLLADMFSRNEIEPKLAVQLIFLNLASTKSLDEVVKKNIEKCERK